LKYVLFKHVLAI